MMSSDPDVHRRERQFWDARAQALDFDALGAEDRVLAGEPCFQFLENEVREAAPQSLLELGSGTGVGSSRLSATAGRVIALDVSSGALLKAKAYNHHRGRGNVAFVCAPGESLPFRDASFDMIVGYFILHHLTDLEAAGREIARVLRPGGQAVFLETWAHNPLLRAGRRIAGALGWRQGTDDERPIERRDLALLERHFCSTAVIYPSLDLVKFAHIPMLRARARWGRFQSIRVAVDRLWPVPIAIDDWLYHKVPAVRPFGWHAALAFTR